MKLSEMLDERLVKFNFHVNNKDDAIHKIAELMYKAEKISDKEAYISGIYQREESFATGIGQGIAIPHCNNDCIKEAAFSLIQLQSAIEWGSLDDKPVNYIIMLAAPISSDNIHLKVLSKLAKNLMDDDFRSGLMHTSSIEEIKRLFKEKGE